MTCTTREACRICHGTLERILDLGTLHLSTFPRPDMVVDRSAVPLDLCCCVHCSTVQLRHTADPELLFRHYWYRSGINETMVAELRDVVSQALLRYPVQDGDVVLDVGANDGTLLRTYDALEQRVFKVGVEPARNLRDTLIQHVDDLEPTFFPNDLLTRRYYQKVAILTSIACFYDADDPGDFVAAVDKLLAPRGLWVVQFQDLHQMIQATAFDNICHEHLVYYSLASFDRLIRPYGLRVVHAEQRRINGGSLRLFVQREFHRGADETVDQLRRVEEGCEHWQTLDRFAWQVQQAQSQIRAAVRTAHADGRVIDLYGASTKANTLLQTCGLGRDRIRQAWERSEAKWGRQTVTGIPIVSEAEGRRDPPDVLLVGIWQFRTAILQRERAYLEGDGTILFPLPVVDAVHLSSEAV